MTRIIDALAEVLAGYDALFCDLWGCVHDGEHAHREAVAALRDARSRGVEVVALTNAQRPWRCVARQLSHIGVPEDAWDALVSSGDAARHAMFRGAVGRRVHHIGPEADAVFFEPVASLAEPVVIERVALDEAEGVVCTGPADPHEAPEAYRADLLRAKTMGLKLLCANPDRQVDRGTTREWCAGALAHLYEEMGGESLYFGKPHPPIYDLARQRLSRPVDSSRILAVGDGIETDIRGAMGEDMDSLFVTGGLAAAETRTGRQPDEGALEVYLATARAAPTYAIGRLR